MATGTATSNVGLVRDRARQNFALSMLMAGSKRLKISSACFC